MYLRKYKILYYFTNKTTPNTIKAGF